MSLPPLLAIEEIHSRLKSIFPPGLDVRPNLVREMAAKTIYVFLYGGMVESTDRLLRPSHVYFFTADQAGLKSDEKRLLWLKNSRKPGFRPAGLRWYADTTREPIRDETIRYGLHSIGAVGKVPGFATTSSLPIYFLKADFAALFNPGLTGAALDAAMDQWRTKHLTAAARARMALLTASPAGEGNEVKVSCPDGSVTQMGPGLSSLVSKAVIESFAKKFMAHPQLIWLSESGAKVRHQDAKIAAALGLNIDAATVLPDIILANVGVSGEDTYLVFVEVVATDGAMTDERKSKLVAYVNASGFPLDQCYFGTAFEDREHSAFRKLMPQLGEGTFAWFRAEPDRLLAFLGKPRDLPSLFG